MKNKLDQAFLCNTLFWIQKRLIFMSENLLSLQTTRFYNIWPKLNQTPSYNIPKKSRILDICIPPGPQGLLIPHNPNSQAVWLYLSCGQQAEDSHHALPSSFSKWFFYSRQGSWDQRLVPPWHLDHHAGIWLQISRVTSFLPQHQHNGPENFHTVREASHEVSLL